MLVEQRSDANVEPWGGADRSEEHVHSSHWICPAYLPMNQVTAEPRIVHTALHRQRYNHERWKGYPAARASDTGTKLPPHAIPGLYPLQQLSCLDC